MTDTTEMDLFVHAALPKGKRHYTTRLPGYPKEVQIQGIIYHFCPSCKGWIEGESEAKRVKNLTHDCVLGGEELIIHAAAAITT
jgi:hypothetical protein